MRTHKFKASLRQTDCTYKTLRRTLSWWLEKNTYFLRPCLKRGIGSCWAHHGSLYLQFLIFGRLQQEDCLHLGDWSQPEQQSKDTLPHPHLSPPFLRIGMKGIGKEELKEK